MHTVIEAGAGEPALPLWLVDQHYWLAFLDQLPDVQATWARAQEFSSERNRVLLLPRPDGALAGAVYGLGEAESSEPLTLWDGAALSGQLPAATYRVATTLAGDAATALCLGWMLGGYRSARYRSATAKPPSVARLIAPPQVDLPYAQAAARALASGRDLINAPANELGPAQLADVAAAVVQELGGTLRVVRDEALERDYPLIAAVGAASARRPCLIDARWPRAGAPRVTLVGKGVCFDTGGLDLKPSAAMLLMKKDMGGAACALALAQLLMVQQAPIELRLLIPAVENSIGGGSFRPGDVLRSRKGLTVEIGNTDAEGRLVLADALADADAEQPQLLVDFATLTGAARTALGPDLPAAFANDETLVNALAAAGRAQADPVWPMPLWKGYDEELSSRIADLNNVSASPFAGAIIGALFLRRFVSPTTPWLHLDLFAWNPRERPGRPIGAEVQGVRAAYRLIRDRFG